MSRETRAGRLPYSHCSAAAHLRVHQCVVEQEEPVDGEPAGVLQRQGLVAALADEAALRHLQCILQTPEL